MPYEIKTRGTYELQIKICNFTNPPPLVGVARPLLSSAAYFDIGASEAADVATIQPTSYPTLYNRHRYGPYLTASDASLATISGSNFFVVGAGAPLMQQNTPGAPPTFVNHAPFSVRAETTGSDTVLIASFAFGAGFTNARTFQNTWTSLPRDAVSENSPVFYDAAIFNAQALDWNSSENIFWSGFISVNVQSVDPDARDKKICGTSFGVGAATGGNQNDGMSGSGGGV